MGASPADFSVDFSTDAARIDVDLVHTFLSASYWAEGRSRFVVEESIRNSLCFGAYADKVQVAFARVVTDFATFAYLADVFVVPDWRGRGLSKRLMAEVLNHPRLKNLSFLLRTRDAHGLYRRFGFERPKDPERFMVMRNLHELTEVG
jgi:GNAT superfamily N-acetyltransferase